MSPLPFEERRAGRVADKRLPLVFHPLQYSHADDALTRTYYRAAIPGGWMVLMGNYAIALFVPDPEHKWDGGSIDVKRGGQ